MMRSDEVQGSRSPKRRRSAKVSSGLSLTIVGRGLLTEAEVGLVEPHPVKDDPQLAGEGDLGPLGTSPLGYVHGPGLELRPSCNPRHDDVRGLE